MEKHKKEKLPYSVCQVLRIRWGLTQAKLAAAAGVGQADISEMEIYVPYGQIDKYLRVASFFGVSVDAVVKNDFRCIPGERLSPPTIEFCDPIDTPEKVIGRMGEELAYETELERMRERFPGLCELVLPYYKMRLPSPGYDILSYDDDGLPVYMEVKTSRPGTVGFRFTDLELRTAKACYYKGANYIVRNIIDWGTDKQRIIDLPFREIMEQHSIKAKCYWCTPKPHKQEKTSGLAYFRKLRGMKQNEFVELMGITQTECSLYETGARKPGVDFYIKASEVLDASIEELVCEYDVAANVEEGACEYGN